MHNEVLNKRACMQEIKQSSIQPLHTQTQKLEHDIRKEPKWDKIHQENKDSYPWTIYQSLTKNHIWNIKFLILKNAYKNENKREKKSYLMVDLERIFYSQP